MFLYAFLALFFASCDCKDGKGKSAQTQEDQKIKKSFDKEEAKKELKEMESSAYLEKYVENIINNGSKGLGFPGGDMQKGFADRTTAKDIAKYVVTLSGKKSSDDGIAQKAQMFYTSNCGGCHGDDGKGLGGSFPNLTLAKLKGVEKREFELKTLIQ